MDLIKDISLDKKYNKVENNKKKSFQKNSSFNEEEITKKDTDIIENQKNYGINESSYFMKIVKDKNTFDIDEFNLKDVTGDGNYL